MKLESNRSWREAGRGLELCVVQARATAYSVCQSSDQRVCGIYGYRGVDRSPRRANMLWIHVFVERSRAAKQSIRVLRYMRPAYSQLMAGTPPLSIVVLPQLCPLRNALHANSESFKALIVRTGQARFPKLWMNERATPTVLLS